MIGVLADDRLERLVQVDPAVGAPLDLDARRRAAQGRGSGRWKRICQRFQSKTAAVRGDQRCPALVAEDGADRSRSGRTTRGGRPRPPASRAPGSPGPGREDAARHGPAQQLGQGREQPGRRDQGRQQRRSASDGAARCDPSMSSRQLILSPRRPAAGSTSGTAPCAGSSSRTRHDSHHSSNPGAGRGPNSRRPRTRSRRGRETARGGALQRLAASGIVGRLDGAARRPGRSDRGGFPLPGFDDRREPGPGLGETRAGGRRPGLGRLLADVRRDGAELHGPADGRAAGRADQGRVRDQADADFGWVLAAFYVTYALFQVPAGYLVDRWDVRWTYAGAVAWWSLAAMATAFVPSLGLLIACRALLGVGESFNWPCAAGDGADPAPLGSEPGQRDLQLGGRGRRGGDAGGRHVPDPEIRLAVGVRGDRLGGVRLGRRLAAPGPRRAAPARWPAPSRKRDREADPLEAGPRRARLATPGLRGVRRRRCSWPSAVAMAGFRYGFAAVQWASPWRSSARSLVAVVVPRSGSRGRTGPPAWARSSGTGGSGSWWWSRSRSISAGTSW